MVEDLLGDISKANLTQPASTIHSQINSHFHAAKSLQLLFRGWGGGSHFCCQTMALQNDRHASAHELVVDEFAHGLHQDARHRSKVFNLQIHLSSSKLLSRFTWRFSNEVGWSFPWFLLMLGDAEPMLWVQSSFPSSTKIQAFRDHEFYIHVDSIKQN